MPKHGRNKQKHAQRKAAALARMGGVIAGNVKKTRKPREIELPVLLAADKRCKVAPVAVKHTNWVDVEPSEQELELMLSRIADKQAKAFSVVAG